MEKTYIDCVSKQGNLELKEEITGWKNFHNKELHNFYSSSAITE
jgi:hypothetical protein